MIQLPAGGREADTAVVHKLRVRESGPRRRRYSRPSRPCLRPGGGVGRDAGQAGDLQGIARALQSALHLGGRSASGKLGTPLSRVVTVRSVAILLAPC